MSNTSIGLLTIAAILLGPIVALQLQRWLDDARESQKRKLYIFKTLMTNRVTTVSLPFVQALNLISVEFVGNNEADKSVRTAWKILLDHLSGDTKAPNWDERYRELTIALLMAMGKALGYSFDEVDLKKGGYYPTFLANIEQEQHGLRSKLLELLDGRRRLPVAAFEDSFPALTDADLAETDKK